MDDPSGEVPTNGEARKDLMKLIPRLRRFALAMTGSRADGDDLVQDTLERALWRLDQWRPGTRLDAWVFRIAKNLWIDQIRSRRVRERIIVSDPDADAQGIDGRSAMDAALTLSKALQVLRALPEEQRTVITLVQIEGFTYREAAEILGIPEGTVTSRLVRARAVIEAQVLGEDGGT
jgi:RNA polymerase sigma-70 factor (ECF subfamily)